MEFTSKFDEVDTSMGSCFAIQVVVLVDFTSSDDTQIDLKSNIAMFLIKH